MHTMLAVLKTITTMLSGVVLAYGCLLGYWFFEAYDIALIPTR